MQSMQKVFPGEGKFRLRVDWSFLWS